MIKKYLAVVLAVIFLIGCNVQNDQPVEWFPFNAEDDFSASEIDMHDWMDAPAGKHGYVQIDGSNFKFEDNTPVKFWGVNICSSLPYSENQKADQWAQYLSKYGVNAVRFHKFSSHGITGNISTELAADKYEKFDYFHHALKEKGIYVGWSHIYGHKPKPGDKDKLVAYEELVSTEFPWAHLNGATISLVNFAPDLQDLHIDLTVNMLNHVNEVTGLRYAEDPALSFIELQNEDNIFWGAIEESLNQTPTYKAMLCQQFSEWLKNKYGNHQALVEAWGKEAIPEGESLHKMNIFPNPSHGFFSHEYEQAYQENRNVPRHVSDKALFLYETQVKFYDRFIKAIKETGYEGPIVASCWQAGSGISHFFNLHADYIAGIIDRHNYYAGGTGHRLVPGDVRNVTMLNRPGSGLLSTGMQMVKDRPFALSEWMSLVPAEWTAEASPIVATYGMGLQGWDASYAFASNMPGLTNTLESPNHGVYNADSPLQMGLYPALARMVYRGDVMKGKEIVVRAIHLDSLKKGKIGFYEQVKQDYDVKSFDGTVPSEALAVGTIPVTFTEQYQETPNPDLGTYWDRENKRITSNTGQLEWNYADKGYYTINTPGTKALVGFSSGEPQQLGDISIETDNEFAVIYITSLVKDQNLESANKILVTTVARARNTGMQYNSDTTKLIEPGTAPILMEPVNLTLTLARNDPAFVYVLDHQGRKTGKTVPVNNNQINIDGNRHQTIYYLIEYE